MSVPTNPSSNKLPVVAVDGPANSGKGTIAAGVAGSLNLAYLDTGVIYRSLAYLILKQQALLNSDVSSLEKAAISMISKGEVLETVKDVLALSALEQQKLIRTEVISELSSRIATIPNIRASLLDLQRDFVKNALKEAPGAILDGRDIGSVVFPNAVCKIYVTASIEVRAKRRQKAVGGNLSFQQAFNELFERDSRDKNRKTAPLVCGNDYIELDTTVLSKEQSVAAARNIIVESFLSAGFKINQ